MRGNRYTQLKLRLAEAHGALGELAKLYAADATSGTYSAKVQAYLAAKAKDCAELRVSLERVLK